MSNAVFYAAFIVGLASVLFTIGYGGWPKG